MGDRANIVLREKDTADIYVYTHWSGSEWPEAAPAPRAAGRGRWGDAQYLNRIIVREVFQDLTGDTGGGLSTVIGDNSYPLIVIEHASFRDPDRVFGWVYLADPETEQPINSTRFTFQQYVDLPEATWAALGMED